MGKRSKDTYSSKSEAISLKNWKKLGIVGSCLEIWNDFHWFAVEKFFYTYSEYSFNSMVSELPVEGWKVSICLLILTTWTQLSLSLSFSAESSEFKTILVQEKPHLIEFVFEIIAKSIQQNVIRMPTNRQTNALCRPLTLNCSFERILPVTITNTITFPSSRTTITLHISNEDKRDARKEMLAKDKIENRKLKIAIDFYCFCSIL